MKKVLTLQGERRNPDGTMQFGIIVQWLDRRFEVRSITQFDNGDLLLKGDSPEAAVVIGFAGVRSQAE
jgi:hypothetical protein